MQYPLSVLKRFDTPKKYRKFFVRKIIEGIFWLNSLKISSCEESEKDRCSYEELTKEKLLILIQDSNIHLSFNSHIWHFRKETHKKADKHRKTVIQTYS